MTTRIRDAVMGQFERKIAAGEALAAAIADEDNARRALEDASANVTKSRQAALKAGWTEAELKRLDLVPTARATRTRRTTTAPSPSPQPAHSDDHDQA